MAEQWDAVVIGGGFYGLYLAGALGGRLERVLVCERGPEVMCRASYANQARVHNGYHYPRSLLTALRSRVNYPRFVAEFRDAVDDSFTQVYAVARSGSKVSAEQFRRFMRRVGAPVEPAPASVRQLFGPRMVEEVFRTHESAFNATALRATLLKRLVQAGVQIRTGTMIRRVRPSAGDAVEVEMACAAGEQAAIARRVFCCAYAQINQPLKNSGLDLIPLKHELAEIALIEPPAPLRGLGVTVVDGPFFSCMPFPARGLHSLSHVRYTPHGHWQDGGADYRPADEIFEQAGKETAFPHMVRDAARYLPALADGRYVESLWEVKTLLPRSEVDDSRPILFRPHHGLRNFHVVMGGKIDNVYDVLDEMKHSLGDDLLAVPTPSAGHLRKEPVREHQGKPHAQA